MTKTSVHSPYWYGKKDRSKYIRPFHMTRSFFEYNDIAWRKAGVSMAAAGLYGASYVKLGMSFLLLNFYMAADIGVEMCRCMTSIADGEKRERVKSELYRYLRIVRRPVYYAREKARRRALAAERRKVAKRKINAPMPSPGEIAEAWNERKKSREAMMRLGTLLDNLSCYVDSALHFNSNGDVVGRNGGIRGWLKENLPELSPKYKTLMRYKALASRLRQIAGVKDPVPATRILEEPRPKIVNLLLTDDNGGFSGLFREIETMLSPETVFRERPEYARELHRKRSMPFDG